MKKVVTLLILWLSCCSVLCLPPSLPHVIREVTLPETEVPLVVALAIIKGDLVTGDYVNVLIMYTVLERWYCFCFLELLRKRIVLESSLKTEGFSLSSSVDGLGRWRLSCPRVVTFLRLYMFRVLCE